VSYGSGERPKYQALARSIEGFYSDLLVPLNELRETTFLLTGLNDEVQKADAPFRFGAKVRRALDRAIEKFLDAVAGPDRTRKGYVNGGIESDTPDGVLQQRQIMSYAVGLRRASDLLGAAQTLTPSRGDPAVREMLDHAFLRLSENGKMRLEDVRDEIHGILVSGTEAGLNPLDVGRQLSKQFDNYSGYEFERLARTEAAFAAEAGNREQLREFGVLYIVWLLAAGACPICQAYEGKIIPIDDEENQPPAHPNCCIEGTVVSGPRALASTERWFVGEVIELQTVGGHVLTVTPNHPILTPKGWVAAGLLNEGDEVVSSTDCEVPTMARVSPDNYQIPALIEDVARSLWGSSPVTATRVPTSAEDFHGDGLGSEVCIVRTNGELRDALDAPLSQPLRGELFAYRHPESFGLSRAGSGAERLVSIALSTARRLRCGKHLLSPVGITVRRESGLYIARTVERDVVISEDASDSAPADLKVPSEGELVLAGKVESDQLVMVNRRQFSGHVFNLQTNSGWYVANNIITHNCMCSASPYTGGLA